MRVDLSKLPSYLFLVSLLFALSFGLVVRDGVQTSRTNALDSANSLEVDFTNTTTVYTPVPIDLTEMGGYWVGPLNIGTPDQPFKLIYDTASGLIFVPLKGSTEAGGNIYDPDKSTSKVITGAPYPASNLNYIGGSGTGSVYTDIIGIGNDLALTSPFPFIAGSPPAAVKNSKTGLSSDGLFGLGIYHSRRDADTYDIPSYISTLLQHLSSTDGAESKFAFLPTKSGIQFTVGGDNPSVVNSLHSIFSLKVRSAQFWVVALSNIRVSGRAMAFQSSNTVTLDTGSNSILGPTQQVNALYAEMKAATPGLEIGTDGTAPCNSKLPDIVVELGDPSGQKQFTIPGQSLLFGLVQDGDLCELVIQGSHTATEWLFGTPFLKTVYSQYNYGTVTPPEGGVGDPTTEGFTVGLIPLTDI